MTVALQGDVGKRRPALVIQADLYAKTSAVTVLPVTSTLLDAPLLRIGAGPAGGTGLMRPSQVMVDKPQTVRRDKVGPVIGRLDDAALLQVSRALALFLGLG